jgi:hypothetical protein
MSQPAQWVHLNCSIYIVYSQNIRHNMKCSLLHIFFLCNTGTWNWLRLKKTKNKHEYWLVFHRFMKQGLHVNTRCVFRLIISILQWCSGRKRWKSGKNENWKKKKPREPKYRAQHKNLDVTLHFYSPWSILHYHFSFVQRSFTVRSACVHSSFSVRSPFT